MLINSEKTKLMRGLESTLEVQFVKRWWIDLKSIYFPLKIKIDLKSIYFQMESRERFLSSYWTAKRWNIMWQTTLIFNTFFRFTERYLNIWAFHEGGSGHIGGAGACWEWVVHKRPNTPLLLSRFALPISNNATVKLSSLFRGVYFEYNFTPQLLTRFACPVLNQVREHVAWVLLYFVSLPFST